MEWIDAKDQQPEDEVKVLLYAHLTCPRCEYDEILIGSREYYTDNAEGEPVYRWYCMGEEYVDSAVTHWMPLPAKPK
jgi:hypothetical protein